MPFSSRLGFYQDQAVAPAPADTIWYDIIASEWQTQADTFAASGAPVDSTIQVSQFTGNDFRYRGSVLHTNGNIYYPPRSSGDGILEFDPSTNTSQYRTDGDLSSLNSSGGAYFHSGVLTESGNILCIPFNHTAFVQFDPVAGTATSFGSLTGTVKFTGGELLPDGRVLCFPQNYSSFVIADPVNETIESQTWGLSLGGATKFWGGCKSSKDDKIYIAPLRFGSVAVYDYSANAMTTETYGQTFSTSSNQYYGACQDKFGNVIMIRGDVNNSICINPDSNTAYTFGSAIQSYGGCMGSDGNVYSTSKQGSAIRKFDFSGGNASPTESTIVTPASGRNYSGGVCALNGNVYISPDRNYATDNMYVIDCQGNAQSVTNSANIMVSTYFKTNKM